MTKEMTKKQLLEKINKINGDISLKKDGNNPFYKSKYITLDNIMDKLQPLLDREWLIVYNVNIPWGVKTIVTDGEEEIWSEFMVDNIVDPQQLWKVCTYWRRYNLTSIFNLLADEDDDAQSFYEDKKEKKPAQKKVSWFQSALTNVEFQKQCLDENDFIQKIKNKYELDDMQESQLRSAYEKNTKEDDLIDLPFD